MSAKLASALAIATVLLVCGCGTSPAPTPAPGTDRYGAPLVSEPRDLRSHGPAPCDGPLGASELRSLGFNAAGRPSRLGTGANSCTWEDYGTKQSVSFVVYPSSDILVDTYRTRLFPQFNPTMIEGLPAVQEQSSSDATACTITVGTAEGQGFVSTYTQLEVPAGEQPDDPCARGRRIVERIVAALPPLQK